MPGFVLAMPTHYAPGESPYRPSWCGQRGVVDRGLRWTRDPKRVSCRLCLKSMRRHERIYNEVAQ